MYARAGSAKKHVSLMFHTGASLPDPTEILDGEGATSRSLKILHRDDLVAKTPGIHGLVQDGIEQRDGKGSFHLARSVIPADQLTHRSSSHGAFKFGLEHRGLPLVVLPVGLCPGLRPGAPSRAAV